MPLPGKGWSSPVILEGKIWLTTAEREGRSLRVLAVDFETGRILHNVEVFQPASPLAINSKNSHASPTAVIEPGRVYVHFGSMGTACLSTSDAKILWKNNDLVVDHKEGPGSSPILYRDLLIVHCDGKDRQFVAALDKLTGKLRWKGKRTAPLRENPEFKKSYGTPILITFQGKPQLISPAADQLNVIDPDTGSELWRVRYIGFSNVPLVQFDGEKLYFCTGYTSPQLWAVRIGGTGDVTDSHVVWKFTRQVPANPSPILVDDQIYFVSDGGVVSAVETKNGRLTWQKRLGGNFSASPILVSGHLFFPGENGKMTVIKPGNTPQIVTTIDCGSRLMATPAVVEDVLLVRTEAALLRIEKPKSQTSRTR